MSLHPFVSTKHPIINIVIVRENEENLYAGIEHQQIDEVVIVIPNLYGDILSDMGCTNNRFAWFSWLR
jgi:isocitrate/isopropylmalate dehydrogenase